jgi:D-serine deaminase-like pyridoxal phosphate-dependent protein
MCPPALPSTLGQLPTPALLLDLDILERNVERMAQRARQLGVALRPHVKTHKSPQIGRLQQGNGAQGITVSTLEEAAAFADHGFDDLTWAVPVILGRLEEAQRLAERVRLRLVIDSAVALEALEASGFPFHVWLEVDCGDHRCGVDPEGREAAALAAALAASPRLCFDGLLTHSGQAYRATSPVGLPGIAEQERRVMTQLADRLRRAGVEVPAVSIGSTPAMSAAASLEGVDEARPGNYVFYDFTQVELGSCEVGDCALTVLSSVISCQPGARYAVVDAGALALSKDPGRGGGKPTLGEVFEDYRGARLSAGVRLTGLSQEHGLLSAPLPVGTRLRILPNHSCLTAACFDGYWVLRGTQVVDRWPILRHKS